MDIKNLLKKMTLKEKLAKLSQYSAMIFAESENGELTGPAVELNLTKDDLYSCGSTLGTTSAKEMKALQKTHLEKDKNDIPMIFMQDVIHGFRTIYPIPLALGASFEPEVAEQCCKMASSEMSAAGIQVTFAPMVDLVRDPRWGRCMESTGEDPYLNSEMAKAMVRGFQNSEYGVAACVKHFAAYGAAEAGRDYNTVDMSERTLRDFYLPAYKAAVDVGVKMLMTSFNILNGVPSSGNKRLVKDLLRDEWGFDGVVISDYNAFREMMSHGYCETEYDCAEKAMRATSDIEMMSSCYLGNIPKLIEEGKISEKEVDEAVLRVLKLKEEAGLFDNPYAKASEEAEKELYLSGEHRDIAKKAAEKSAVLLKNEGVLPFDKKKTKKVALIGPFANQGMIGAWACCGNSDEAISVMQGVKNLLPNAEVTFSMGCSEKIDETDISDIPKAVAIAKEAETVILCLGESFDVSGESRSRAKIQLSEAQKTLIREIVKVNKNTAVVLFCGRALVLTDIIDDIPALVTMWQPGTEGGSACANLLFGETNFSGKLPMTFPRSEGQIPIYYNSYRTGRPHMDENKMWESGIYSSSYIDMLNAPLFPFGYGLSYTTFEISQPVVDKTEINRGEKAEVSVTVKNTGNMVGEEVLQLYIHDEVASLARPIKELKSFKKIELKAGEDKEVKFEITEEMLKFWSNNNKFEAENGAFTVWISDSSITKDGIKIYLK